MQSCQVSKECIYSTIHSYAENLIIFAVQQTKMQIRRQAKPGKDLKVRNPKCICRMCAKPLRKFGIIPGGILSALKITNSTYNNATRTERSTSKCKDSIIKLQTIFRGGETMTQTPELRWSYDAPPQTQSHSNYEALASLQIR